MCTGLKDPGMTRMPTSFRPLASLSTMYGKAMHCLTESDITVEFGIIT